MTRGAREIMFHVMALRAKSGYVLQQLNGFSRMRGSRKKKGEVGGDGGWGCGGVSVACMRGS